MRWILPASLVGLVGCTTPRLDALHEATSAQYVARSAVVPTESGGKRNGEGDLAKLLGGPVTADAAVQIAFLKNPRVSALYSRLGFARADLYDAARLSNPVLGFVNLSGGEGARKIDWSLSQNFTELLFLKFRKEGAQSRALSAEQQVARELLDLEADVRSAHVRYIGSRTLASVRDRIVTSSRVSADYARSLFDAGNISALQLSRAEEAAQLARAEAIRAHVTESGDRNVLFTLLGMPTDASVDIAGSLALPTDDTPNVRRLQTWALENRLDLQSARESLRFASIANTHARRWRWLGDTTIGVSREKDGAIGAVPAETLTGPSASIALPLFNQGTGSVDRTRAAEEILSADVQGLEVSIGNDVATRLAAVGAARESVALYREKVVPLQRTIVEESQKQQNYMLIGTFELIAARQHQYEGYEAYLDALRDYWLATIDLMRATGGRFPGFQAQGAGSFVDPLAPIEAAHGEHP